MRSARWIVVALAALCGCLLEQPIEEDTDELGGRNHPPAILSRSPSASVLHLQRACKPKFTLSQVEDRDLGDDIEVKWFVNYDDGNVNPVDRWFVPASEADGPVRFLDGEYMVDLELYDANSVVVVEAVVSDGFADPNQPPRNRAIAKGRGVAVATWTIVISEGSWCNRP